MFLFLSLLLATATPPLPLIDVPPARGSSETVVVFVSGDGGWAKIDKSISAVLANEGMPVTGLNSLQYFWTKRTPETASHDLGTIIDSSLARWKKQNVILIGYSRGADVLPAMVARLTPEQRSKIRLLALLAPSRRVEFEFHVVDWMHDSKKGMAVEPELAKLTSTRSICIWGDDDTDSLCRGLSLPHVKVVTLHGSHHFDGDYAKLARIILEALD